MPLPPSAYRATRSGRFGPSGASPPSSSPLATRSKIRTRPSSTGTSGAKTSDGRRSPTVLVVPVGLFGLLDAAASPLLEPDVVAAADQRHAEQEPRVGPGRREPERDRRGGRAPPNRPLFAGGKARIEGAQHQGRIPATFSSAVCTLVESSEIAATTANVITARTTPYSAIV